MGTATGSRFVGLVADDLTGAADAAVQFAVRGWDARLLRKMSSESPARPPGEACLHALTTSTRASTDTLAATRTAAAVSELSLAGADRLFLKVDSTVRGSVAGQVAGALSAWRRRHRDALAVVCPAFPDLGRTVAHGTVLVDDRPVADSDSGDDPVTPVTVSALDRLIPGSQRVGVAELVAAPGSGHCFVLDAVTNDDLDEVAAAVELLGPRAIAVGSAGLARAVAGVAGAVERTTTAVSPVSRILVAVSSPHRAARLQVAALLQSHPQPEPDHRAGRAHPDELQVSVLRAPEERAERGRSAAVATVLAQQVAARIAASPIDALVLVGGDGALAVLDACGAAQVRVLDNLAPGTPRGVVLGGRLDGLQLVTRSGGFGPPDALVQIVQRLSQPQSLAAIPPRHSPPPSSRPPLPPPEDRE